MRASSTTREVRRATGWFVLAIGAAVVCLGCSSRTSTPSNTSTGAVSRTDRVHELNTTLSAQMPRDGSYRSVGEGKDSVQVHLRADQEALAADLIARYGDLVSITVGAYPYPLPSPASVTTPDLCKWSVPVGAEVVGGLRATPMAAGSVQSGHDGRGTVTVTNTSNASVSFSGGTPYAAVLLKSGTDAVVGVYDSEIAGVGSGATLRSGEHLTVDMLIGTASCDAVAGYAVAPGIYDVIVVLNDIQIGGTGALQKLRSARASVSITS